MNPDEQFLPKERETEQEINTREQVEGPEPLKEETEVNPDDSEILRSE